MTASTELVRVDQLGEGEPEVAVVGAVHGDEPCGREAIDRLLDEDPDVDRPVKLIIANEEALAAGRRYLDEDLNRAFPGSPDAATREGRLAHALLGELEGCTTFSMHSTQSTAEPFALVETVGGIARAVVPHLPVDVLVETEGFTEGRLIEHPHTVEVECGLQGSPEAAENAYWLTRAFLAATGVLPAPTADDHVEAGDRREVDVFRLREQIPKPPASEYEVFVRNFEEVAAGQRYAAADGEPFYADEPFYPVLMSAYGYTDLFGYAGEKVGTLD